MKRKRCRGYSRCVESRLSSVHKSPHSLVQEIDILQVIPHPFIVHCFGAFEVSVDCLYVLELLTVGAHVTRSHLIIDPDGHLLWSGV